MIDGRNEVLGRAEAEGAMADGVDLVVHALDGSVGEADFGPGKNSIQVRARTESQDCSGSAPGPFWYLTY